MHLRRIKTIMRSVLFSADEAKYLVPRPCCFLSFQLTNHIECTLVDFAISDRYNVGFSHLRSLMRGKHTNQRGDGSVDQVVDQDAYVIEAMAVHVFRDDGKMINTWLLR